MKNFFLTMSLVTLTMCAISCSQSKSKSNAEIINVEITEYNDSVTITPAKNEERELKDGLAYGFVENVTKTYGKEENTMIDAFTNYMENLKNGDVKSCKKYFDYDMFLYFKKLAQQEGEVINMDDLVESMSSGIKGMYEELTKSEMQLKFSLACLNRRINFGDKIFIIFSNTINIIDKDNLAVHLIPFETTVGISKDKGQTWAFIGLMDDSFPSIYADVYPQEVIDAIMNY